LIHFYKSSVNLCYSTPNPLQIIVSNMRIGF